MYVCECVYKWIENPTGKWETIMLGEKEKDEKKATDQTNCWQLQVVKIIEGERLCQ
jgi:hypothetical protein